MSQRAASRAELSRRVTSLEVSPTVAMSQRAGAMKAAGRRILDFSVGEPDQGTPAPIVAAAITALHAGKTRYSPAAGLPELRAAVARRYAATDRVSFTPDEVAITVGGKQALYLACQALLDPGDDAVVPSPYWPTFAEAVRLAGGRPVFARTREEDGFRVSARLISQALTRKTRVVIVNSPSNPTGAVIEAAELLALARLARRRGFTILYDDTYARLVFGGASPRLQAARAAAGERFVVIGTASKTYCMTGWRLGWVLGPKDLVNACAALVSHSTQCPTTFVQAAAAEALDGPQDVVSGLAAEYRRRRDYIHPALAEIPGLKCVRPDGGFYAFPRLERYLSRDVPSTLALCTKLLERQGVALVPGEGFGAPGYARLSFARPMEELREGVDRLATFLGELVLG